MSAHGPATLVLVEGSGGIVYAFGVGLANFGAGRSRLPRQIADDVREVLPLIAWSGAIGNLALEAGNLWISRSGWQESRARLGRSYLPGGSQMRFGLGGGGSPAR